ncbi:MAG: 30S ribosomal protein S2 [Chloroflexi bacterium]|nr:30S ribosomal protein S2 [Chloroflexota bacterium]
MAVVSMKALLESGVHFGHRTNKWDPRMKPYIFTERNGIHIIDLQQTVKALNNAYNVIRDRVAEGGVVMFVGTKRQAQETVREEAERCGMPYVTERWLGGMLTNWVTMHQRVVEMDKMDKLLQGGDLGSLTKKEGLLIQREFTRLDTRLSGVRKMNKLPDLLFVVDVSRELAAVHEANLLGIPVVALVDTNCNPSNVDYIIPSNDDAIRAIKLLVGKIADAVLEGKAMRKDEAGEEQKPVDADQAPLRKPARVVETDEELADDQLLGESTLAKMTPAVEEPAAVAEVAVEPAAVEQAAVEDVAVEPAVEPVSEPVEPAPDGTVVEDEKKE